MESLNFANTYDNLYNLKTYWEILRIQLFKYWIKIWHLMSKIESLFSPNCLSCGRYKGCVGASIMALGIKPLPAVLASLMDTSLNLICSTTNPASYSCTWEGTLELGPVCSHGRPGISSWIRMVPALPIAATAFGEWIREWNMILFNTFK